MPYLNNTQLPDSIKNALPDAAQSIFRRVFNSQDNAGKSEAVSMASAWAAVKNAGYMKQDGKWIKKIEPADVHTDKPLDEYSVQKDYKLPESARNNARKVLEWKEKYGDEVKGMTETGWRRARQLANNESVGAETVKAMSQFARHKANSKVADEYKNEPWKDRGYVAWLGWGGDSGISWAQKTSDSINKSFSINCQFAKMDDEKRLVYGFASIIEEDGKPVEDYQGDIISESDLVEAAHDYVMKSRAAKVMHKGVKRGELVESLVLTDDVKKALNSSLGTKGWFVGFKIHDDETWQAIKKGELGMFSIGGRGKRREREKEV